MFFKKKAPPPKPEQPRNYYFTNDYADRFDPNEDELNFFNILSSKTIGWKKGKFKLERMANGTISVYLPEGFVGKVNLRAKQRWIMILPNLYDSKIIYGSIEELSDCQEQWIRYSKRYL